MDPAFLDLPPEVIRTSMRTHQKYFAVRDPGDGRPGPHFVVVANIEAADGGTEIARRQRQGAVGAPVATPASSGTRTVKTSLEPLAEEAGTASPSTPSSAPWPSASSASPPWPTRSRPWSAPIRRKADRGRRLRQGRPRHASMVGEFPELQGLMGGYYARGSTPARPQTEIADAIRDHYKPVGRPPTAVPAAPVSVAVALADKLDTLVGFFAIDEKPTGSKDPYALRRAALGVIRIPRCWKAEFARLDADTVRCCAVDLARCSPHQATRALVEVVAGSLPSPTEDGCGSEACPAREVLARTPAGRSAEGPTVPADYVEVSKTSWPSSPTA